MLRKSHLKQILGTTKALYETPSHRDSLLLVAVIYLRTMCGASSAPQRNNHRIHMLWLLVFLNTEQIIATVSQWNHENTLTERNLAVLWKK